MAAEERQHAKKPNRQPRDNRPKNSFYREIFPKKHENRQKVPNIFS